MTAFKVRTGIVLNKNLTLIKDGGIEKEANIVRQPNTFYPGDVVESDCDLERAIPGRFDRMQEYAPINAPTNEGEPVPDDAISGMSVSELKDVAEREEIDLGDATLKADISRTLRKGLVDKFASV